MRARYDASLKGAAMARKRERTAHVRAQPRPLVGRHPMHNFTLVLAGVREPLSDELEHSVFEAGCDDAILGIRNGVAFLEFDRQAATLPEAILAAIQDVETVEGIDVLRVEPDDLVTASEIARRTGRSRESIRLLAAGMRGPGGFPPPVHNLRGQSPLWRWAEVAEWTCTHLTGTRVQPQEWESAAFIAVLNSALHIHQLVPTLSTMKALWGAMSRWHAKRPAHRFAWLPLLERARAK